MESREALTAKALACLQREGFHASGVEHLAQQMGVTKRTLYSHFGSKEGLIEAALEYRHQQFMVQMTQALSGNSGSIAQAYLDFIGNWTTSKDFYGCFFINACAEYSDLTSTPHSIAANHKHEVRALLAQFVDVAKADLLYLLGEGLIVAAQTQQSLAPEMKSLLLAAINEPST